MRTTMKCLHYTDEDTRYLEFRLPVSILFVTEILDFNISIRMSVLLFLDLDSIGFDAGA